MDRAEHLAWAKQRAIEYAERGDTTKALASLVSDLHKHPELADHAGISLMASMMFAGLLSDPAEVKAFIEGFN
jgi:hypothetical protein